MTENAQADWVLHGGRIHTFDQGDRTVSAVALAGGRVLATGTDEQVRRYEGTHTRRTDLAGRTVLPGFCDTHMHLIEVAQQDQQVVAPTARTAAELAAAIAAHTGSVAPGQWIQARSSISAPAAAEQAASQLPDRDLLDQVAPDHPVFVYRRPDRAALNSRGIAALGAALDALTSQEWDPRTGLLSGLKVRVVREWVMQQFTLDEAAALDTIRRTGAEFAAMGITTLVDAGQAAGFEDAWNFFRTASHTGAFPQRLRVMHHLDQRAGFDSQLALIESCPVPPDSGDEKLHGFGLKMIIDGEFGDAWMRAGEELDIPQRRWYTVEQIRQVVQLCSDRGWNLTIHVMGGGSADAAIDIIREIGDRDGNLRPGQITFAHGFLLDHRAMLACRDLQITVSCHPTLAHMFAAELHRAWGPLAGRAIPIATMIDLGVRVSGGSDATPCNPLFGAANAVTRIGADGRSFGANEAVTPYQAIDLFTRRAGDYVSEPRIGTLSPGSFADLTVWEDDPLDLPVDTWARLTAALTVVDGAVVHGDPEQF